MLVEKYLLSGMKYNNFTLSALHEIRINRYILLIKRKINNEQSLSIAPLDVLSTVLTFYLNNARH